MVTAEPPTAKPAKREAETVPAPADRREAQPPQLSVITTALNESRNVEPWLRAVEAASRKLDLRTEVIFIDDGSTDGTAERLLACETSLPIRLFRNPRSKGITAAMSLGLREAAAPLCALLPADLESDPEADLPALIEAMTPEVDAVAGYRQGRGDGKVVASKIYNLLNAILFRCRVRDANWIKLVRRDKALGVPLRLDWHRFFLPIMAFRGARIVEVPTAWQRRKYGKTKFGMSRLPGAVADLVTVRLLLSFEARPMLAFIGLAGFELAAAVVTGVTGLFAGGLTQLLFLMGALLMTFLAFGTVLLGFACEVIRGWLLKLKEELHPGS